MSVNQMLSQGPVRGPLDALAQALPHIVIIRAEHQAEDIIRVRDTGRTDTEREG